MSVFVESVGLSTISQEFQHLLVSLRGICTGKRSQKDFVGSGRQKIVHLHPADRTKVIAEFRPESAPSHERALGHLEMGKLLHVLFLGLNNLTQRIEYPDAQYLQTSN